MIMITPEDYLIFNISKENCALAPQEHASVLSPVDSAPSESQPPLLAKSRARTVRFRRMGFGPTSDRLSGFSFFWEVVEQVR